MVTDYGEVLDPKENLDLYTLQEIRNNPIWTPENIRKEYSRLRKMANRRLETMAKYEEGRASRTYKQNIGKYKPVSELTLGETKTLLSEVARMIAAKRGSLGGIRAANKQALQTLHDMGYQFINETNIHDFGRFMEAWRASSHRGYGSIYATDLWAAAIKSGVNSKDVEKRFTEWRMAQGKVSPSKGEPSSDELLERFGEFLGGPQNDKKGDRV